MRRWKVQGYAGWYDYDGPQDNNFEFYYELDDKITREDVESIIKNKYKNERILAYEITMIGE